MMLITERNDIQTQSIPNQPSDMKQFSNRLRVVHANVHEDASNPNVSHPEVGHWFRRVIQIK